MAQPVLRVRGLREFVRAAGHAPLDARREVKKALKEAGEPVKLDAAARFASYDRRSAAGYRVVVRQRGVAVVQSLRKTTGLRPEYGALQMRKALLPALWSQQDETEKAVERALDRVADHFEHT